MCNLEVRKRTYNAPSLQYWNSAELDCIEATMSGGGGVVIYDVYIVNNPSFLFGVGGHSAIMFAAHSYSSCSLFSFHPYDNHSNPASGQLAEIAQSSDASNFTSFRNACNTQKGILLKNNAGWSDYEKFTRYIRLGVTYTKYSTMLDLCNQYRNNPPYYSALGSSMTTGINCQGFVNYILSSQGIILKTDLGVSLASNIAPNEVIENASTASGAYYMQKNLL